MEWLINVGYLVLGALGLVLFMVLMWFVIGMALAIKDIFFRRKRKDQNFINHGEIIKKSINNN